MAAKLSITDIDAQIEKLRERRKTLIVKSAERFARAATKAGLAEMEIADEEIDRIFAEIALRAEPDGQRQAGRRAELGIIAVTRALTPCLVTPSYA